jgi:hypothetical protein
VDDDSWADDPQPLKPPPKKPCAECPFKRTSMRGYLGADDVEHFYDRFKHDQVMECHLTVDYDREDKTYLEQIADGEVSYCAGALIMMANQLKRTRDPDRPIMEPDRDNVFTWEKEFTEHHDTEFHRRAVARRKKKGA